MHTVPCNSKFVTSPNIIGIKVEAHCASIPKMLRISCINTAVNSNVKLNTAPYFVGFGIDFLQDILICFVYVALQVATVEA